MPSSLRATFALLLSTGCTSNTVGDSTGDGTSSSAQTDDVTSAVDSSGSFPEECAELPPDAVACPETGDVTTSFAVRIDGAVPDTADIDETCNVTGESIGGDTTTTLSLECPSGAVEIELSTSVHHDVFIGVGDEVDLRYRDFASGTERYFEIRYAFDDGGLIVGAIDATELPPQSSGWFSSLSPSLPATTCPTSTPECIELQPGALRVDFDGSTVDVGSGSEAFVGSLVSYQVVTQEIVRTVCFFPVCLDPGAALRVRAAFFSIPEG